MNTQNKKTVLITGSGRGIGKAIALYFASKEPNLWNIVINCAHQTQELEQTRAQIEALGANCLAIQADVSDYVQTQHMIQQANDVFGPIHVLVNNAGIAHIGLFTDTTPEQWNKVIGTNLTSLYNCCHPIAAQMVREHSGKIINISSVWGQVGASCEVAYSAAKGGVNTFTKALAKELAPSNIQVNAIACGVIDTEMNRCFSEEDRQALIDEIPSCRMGLPEEVAALVHQLSTDHNYLTGQVITLDGGWT